MLNQGHLGKDIRTNVSQLKCILPMANISPA